MEGPEGPGYFRVTRWVIDAMAWRERQGYTGGERSVDSQIIEETFAAASAYVMGRRMFDGGEIPWGDEPPRSCIFSANLTEDSTALKASLKCPSPQPWHGDHGVELEIWRADRDV
jgi:hypothetical protein